LCRLPVTVAAAGLVGPLLGRTGTAAPHCTCHGHHEARLEISLLVRVTEKLALLLIEHG